MIIFNVISKSCKRTVSMIIALMCSSFVFALPYDLKINNICYKIIGDEAMVTVPSDNEEQNHRFYTGKIDIPETISYGLKTYKVTSIGKGTFAYCQDVTEIFVPNSVVTIGDGAFMGHIGMKLHLGAGVKEIGKGAFRMACVTELDLDPANKNFVLEDNILYTADHKRAISLICDMYDETISARFHDDVEIIDDGFSHAQRLVSVKFGNRVKSIGEEAFKYAFSNHNSKQRKLVIPNSVEHIGFSAFYHCIRVDTLILSDNLTRIEPDAFYYVAPEYIHLPKKLKVICDAAFACVSGSAFKNLVLPEGLDSIGKYGIECITCDSLIIPSTVRHLSMYSLSNFSKYVEIKAPLKSIPEYAIPSNSAKKLVLPKETKRIEAFAFYPCYGIKQIVWPEALEYIGSHALAGNKVEPMVVPETVKTLGDRAFADNVWEARTYYFQTKTPPACEGNPFDGIIFDKSTVYVPKGCRDVYAKDAPWSRFGKIEEYEEPIVIIPPTRYDFEKDGLYYNVISEQDKTCEVSYDLDLVMETRTYSGVIDIPETVRYGLNSYTVVGIEDCAFLDTKIESITLPNTIEYIGEAALGDCKRLKSLTIPDKIKVIGSAAFSGCARLTKLVIPETVQEIGVGAFSYCDNLRFINIPEGITTLEASMFEGCTSLASVVLPKNITKIGDEAFYGCSKLTDVSLPEQLDEIGTCAFSNCVNLQKIIFPKKLRIIRTGAFDGCTSLKDVISLNQQTPYPVGSGQFTTNGTLHVPQGCKDSYSSTTMWWRFDVVEDAEAVGIRPLMTVESESAVYDLSGRPFSGGKGIFIKNGKKYIHNSK